MDSYTDKRFFTYDDEDLTFYCLNWVKKHEIVGHSCVTCSKYWLMYKDPENEDFTPVYPLKSHCKRGHKIQHGPDCVFCANWQWAHEKQCGICEQYHEQYDLQHVCDWFCDFHKEKQQCCICAMLNKNCLTSDEFARGITEDGWEIESLIDESCYEDMVHHDEHVAEKQGQGASHPTGNHSTAVQSGGNTTVINYYGQNYNAANNPMSQSIDPQAVASGVADVVGATSNFIASPTVESLAGDQSDRVVMMISGNSAIITQESARGAIIAYGKEPVYLEAQGNSVDLPTRPGPSCDRFYTLPSIRWEPSSNGWLFPLPGILADKGVFGTNLQYHYLYRSGFCIHVQCNATQFHAGCLFVGLCPEYIKGQESGGSGYEQYKFFEVASIQYDLGQQFVLPHQLINLRTNNSATLVWSYNNFTPATCFTTHNNLRLVIAVLTPLQVPQGSEQAVPITVSILPLCSQFNGLRNLVSRQGLPVFEVPGSQQFCTTVANDGFPAFPIWNAQPDFPLAGEVTNLISVARIPTLCKFDNKYYFTVTNKVTQEKIKEIDLSLLSTAFECTYVSRLARAYAFYRGTLDLSLTYCGPKQSSGKLMVCYTPPGGRAPNTLEEAMLGTSVVWDIGLQSTLSFPIPYVSVSPYRYANMSGNIMSYDGYISIFYQTAIVTAPNCPTEAHIFMTLAAGKDFSLHGFMDTGYYQGIGDTLGQAIQSTITNAITGATNSLQPGPTQPESGEIDPGFQIGHSTALEAAETGTSVVKDPSAVVAIEPGSVKEYSISETSVANVFSRYVQAFTWQMDIDGTGKTMVQHYPLSLNNMYKNCHILETFLRGFTYLRTDFDFVMIVSGDIDAEVKFVFNPPGSYTTGGESIDDKQYAGVNPAVIGRVNGPPMSIRVPYLAPSPYMPIHFDGFKTFDGQGYNECEARRIGELSVLINTKLTGTVRVDLYTRLVNPRVYMPRPLYPRPDKPKATYSRGRIEIGDAYNFGGAPDDWDAIAMEENRQARSRAANMLSNKDWTNDQPDTWKQGPDWLMELEYPEGPDYPNGIWINNEFYASMGPDDYSPYLTQICTYAPEPLKYERHSAYVTSSYALESYDESSYMVYMSRHQQRMAIADERLKKYLTFVFRNVAFMYSRVLTSDYETESEDEWEAELQGPLESIGKGLGSGLRDAFTSALKQLEQDRKESTSTWWYTATALVMKFVSMLVIMIRSKGDPGTVAAVAGLIGAELMTFCPFDWIKSHICSLVGVTYVQQQGPTVFRQFLDIANSIKAVDWIVSKLKELIDWIKNKLKPQVDDLEGQASDVDQLVEKVKEWREYQKEPAMYTDQSVEILAHEINHIRQIVEKDQPNNIVLRLYSVVFGQVEKYLINNKKRDFEPIGVLIHGEPGTGKSLATQMIGKSLAKFYKSAGPYSLPPDPTYFDGYKGQPVVIMDDLGQNPDGEDMKMVCQMISTTEYITPQADLPDKGMPFTSRIVLASTNLRDLAPPTVSIPDALRRRFKLDLDIKVNSSYVYDDGKLDVSKAFTPCEGHGSICYTGCCPFICGRAIRFVDRRTKESFSLDTLTVRIRTLDKEKTILSNKIEAFLQGGKSTRRLVRLDDLSTMGRKPLTPEMLELVMEDTTGGMARYAHELGYEVPEQMQDHLVAVETAKNVNKWKTATIILGTILGLLTLGYTIYMAFPSKEEGPYNGYEQRRLAKPIKRVVEEQGPDPDTQFAHSLLRHNIFPVETSTGEYTALGMYGTKVLLPTHAVEGDLYVEGKKHDYKIIGDFFQNGIKTELTIIDVPTLQDFKDLRKFLKFDFQPVKDALLVLNTNTLPRMVIPLRRVAYFGNLNLAGEHTCNTIYYQSPTKRGYCGGVVLKAGYIIGMHIGGDGVNGFGARIGANMFLEPKTQGKIVKEEKMEKPMFVNRKTKFEPSIYHKYLEVTKEPAALSKNDKRLLVDLDQTVLSKYKGNVETWPDELDVAIDQYVSQLKPLIEPGITEPLTIEEAVKGYGKLQALDLHTSAGYPYCMEGVTKARLMENNMSELLKGLDLHGYDLPYVSFLKDELRPIEKVRQGKTRIVEASSVNDTIRMRRTFGRLFEVLTANPGTTTGMAVGCNPDVDWTKFAAEMGNNVFAFDYSNFDASLSPFWFEGLRKVLHGLGFTHLQTKILNHVVNSVHIYGDTKYWVEGGMPSGCSGTSIFNSMINNLIIKTLTLRIYKGIDLSQLKIIAYGDDVIISYPFPLEPKMYAEEGSKLGLTITPADKGFDFGEPTDITGVTFLKRGFRPDERYDFLYHPTFPEEEVYQSLAWTKDPRTMPEHITSLAYLIWHNGEDSYNKFLKFIRQEPIGRVFVLPSYKELMYRWYDEF